MMRLLPNLAEEALDLFIPNLDVDHIRHRQSWLRPVFLSPLVFSTAIYAPSVFTAMQHSSAREPQGKCDGSQQRKSLKDCVR